MSERTLFLAWQDVAASRQWFPVGRLDADTGCSEYRFRYTGGAERAQLEAQFEPLLDFPQMKEDYRSPELFPLFKNRVMAPGRPDFEDYLQALDLTGSPDPVEILSVSGGHRVTDTYEVFPKLVKSYDGSFVCRFFLHGWRRLNVSVQERLKDLSPREELYLALELTNPETTLAVQIQTKDYQMIGWAPHYLVPDLTMAMAESPGKYAAQVVRVNTQPAPARQRVLIEMHSYWNGHEPMAGRDFEPLVE